MLEIGGHVQMAKSDPEAQSPRYRIAHGCKIEYGSFNLEALNFLMHFRELGSSLYAYSYIFLFLIFLLLLFLSFFLSFIHFLLSFIRSRDFHLGVLIFLFCSPLKFFYLLLFEL
jgi:hypothetical protein